MSAEIRSGGVAWGERAEAEDGVAEVAVEVEDQVALDVAVDLEICRQAEGALCGLCFERLDAGFEGVDPLGGEAVALRRQGRCGDGGECHLSRICHDALTPFEGRPGLRAGKGSVACHSIHAVSLCQDLS